MSPTGITKDTPTKRGHAWTQFELHTMLCLIARGTHLETPTSSSTSTSSTKQNAYLTFATMLNNSVHGTDYSNDISKREVTKMLDQMLVERKGVVGKDGLMERQHGGRITRSLRLAWERRKPINFDGSISEWNNGRKKREEAKERERLGLPPQLEEGEVKVGVGDAEKDAASAAEPPEDDPNKDIKSIWRQASQASRELSSSTTSKWLGQKGQNAITAFTSSAASESYSSQDNGMTGLANTVHTNRDSYRVLPAKLRGKEKFSWASPGAEKGKKRGGCENGVSLMELGSYYRPGSVKLVEVVYDHRGSSNSNREAYVPPVLMGGVGDKESHNGGDEESLAMVFGEEIGDGRRTEPHLGGQEGTGKDGDVEMVGGI